MNFKRKSFVFIFLGMVVSSCNTRKERLNISSDEIIYDVVSVDNSHSECQEFTLINLRFDNNNTSKGYGNQFNRFCEWSYFNNGKHTVKTTYSKGLPIKSNITNSLSPIEIKWTEFSSKIDGYTIKFPSNWVVLNKNYKSSPFSFNIISEEYNKATFNIIVSEGEENLSDIYRNQKKDFDEQYDVLDYNQKELSIDVFDEVLFRQFIISEKHFIQLGFRKKTKVLFISASSNRVDFKESIAFYDGMIGSIRFDKSKW